MIPRFIVSEPAVVSQLPTPRRRLLLVRDRTGILPLYYARTRDGVLFASEVKALLSSGQVQAALIAVDHDHRADRPPRETPRRPERVPPLVVAIEEADVERPGEVRASGDRIH